MNRDPNDKLDTATLEELLRAVAPQTPPTGLRAQVLQHVRLNAATRRAGGSEWKNVGPGIESRTLHYDARLRVVSFLLRVQPGGRMPAHEHHLEEECLVLEGEFTMGGVTLRAGDFQFGRQGEHHPETHTQTGVLVYLRGSADDYPFACP